MSPMVPAKTLEWDRFIPALTAFVRRRVAHPADAEDIVQTALVKAVAALPNLRQADRLEAWLYRVARTAVIDHYRAHARHPEAAGVEIEDLAADLPAEPDAELLAELADCAAYMSGNLPAPYRVALDLVDRQGMRQAEAARHLGLSLTALKSRVQRGRRMLREVLEHCCKVSLDTVGRPMDFDNRCNGSDGCRGPGPRSGP